MKVLLINGSLAKHGKIYKLLCQLGDCLNANDLDTDFFWIGENQQSNYQDFLQIAGDYDGYIFATALNRGKENNQLISFIHRVFSTDLQDNHKRFALKPTAIITTNQKAETIHDELHKYFSLMQMPIISLCYFDKLLNSDELTEQINNLANSMAYFLKCKDVATKFGVLAPT